MKLKLLILILLVCCAFKCGGNDPVADFKSNKAERGSDWSQFKHDCSFGVWNFEGDRPAEHRTGKQVKVFWNGTVTAEEKSLIDEGLDSMLSACRQDTVNWTPGNIWTRFDYFQSHPEFKLIFVTSNYTLQEGEAAGCAGMITGANGTITAAGTVGGIVGINGVPASKGGIYIVIPKQSEAQLARVECKNLMKNAVRFESEHIWFTNYPALFYAFANDGANGNHAYCRGNQPF